MSGINYCPAVDAILLVVNPGEVYWNAWIEESQTLVFSGKGTLGDQRLNGENARLANASKAGTDVYAVWKRKVSDYEFLGAFEPPVLAAHGYDVDIKGEWRRTVNYLLHAMEPLPDELAKRIAYRDTVYVDHVFANEETGALLARVLPTPRSWLTRRHESLEPSPMPVLYVPIQTKRDLRPDQLTGAHWTISSRLEDTLDDPRAFALGLTDKEEGEYHPLTPTPIELVDDEHRSAAISIAAGLALEGAEQHRSYDPVPWDRSARLTGDLRVTVHAVGSNDCVLITFPDETNWLVDAGCRSADALASRAMDEEPLRIHTVVLTHSHADHIRDVVHVLQAHPEIERVIYPQQVWQTGTALVDGIWDYLSRHPWIELRDIGLSIPDDSFGGCRLAWGFDPTPPIKDQNNRSLVLSIKHAGTTVVLAGDIEDDQSPALGSHATSQSIVLKAPHHGSWTSAYGWASAQPSGELLSLISCEGYGKLTEKNKEWPPHRGALEAYAARGVTRRTDACGTLVATISASGDIDVESEACNGSALCTMSGALGPCAQGHPRPTLGGGIHGCQPHEYCLADCWKAQPSC